MMKEPLFVRPLSEPERAGLQSGLRSSQAVTLRRSQILLARAARQTPRQVSRQLGGTDQTVRNVLRAFAHDGLAGLQAKSSRPITMTPELDEPKREQCRALLHQSPRTYGKVRSLWTLTLAADVCFDQGLTRTRGSDETIRSALRRLGVSWRRAREWITSPDPTYTRKKKTCERLIRVAEKRSDWVLGYLDEVWWSRLAHPAVHSWADGEPLRLTGLAVDNSDPEPKALACYGLLRADTGQLWLRFVQGRPLSAITTRFLAWVCERLHAAGKKALLLVWDNASWHLSQAVREWIKIYNRQAKREGGVRILRYQLPTKSPWLNRIEPHWVHGKRAIVEPTRQLTANDLIERVCDYYGCEQCPHLSN